MFVLSTHSVEMQTDPISLQHGTFALQLAAARHDHFDALWDLPRQFVEPINYRRNGWSAVSIVQLPDGKGGHERFFLKRQENQTRHSWRYPEGVLTYRYEVDALCRAERQRWPCVELVAYGFRQERGVEQGMVLTRAIESPTLASFRESSVDWPAVLPQLRGVGEDLYAMHASRWQHGALYPGHLFMDLQNGTCQLIDFERARRRLSVAAAAESDLSQLLKRSEWLPGDAINALLSTHRQHLPGVIKRLESIFPQCFKNSDQPPESQSFKSQPPESQTHVR